LKSKSGGYADVGQQEVYDQQIHLEEIHFEKDQPQNHEAGCAEALDRNSRR
jgi:hypothetical protein